MDAAIQIAALPSPGMTVAGRRTALLPHDDTGTVPLTERGFLRICELVRSRFGIHLTAEKQLLVVNRLSRHVQALGLSSYEALADHVEADVTGEALDVLAGLIATNHTYFFREPAHFAFLSGTVLPGIVDRLSRRGENDLRLWCAAASTGEEAYTIAMTLLDFLGPRHAAFDAGLLATDLSLKALRHAAAGLYTAAQMGNVSPAVRQRHVHREPSDEWRVNAALRVEVLVRQFNLVTDPFGWKASRPPR